MGTQGQFRGGGYWHGFLGMDEVLDPRNGAVQMFESDVSTRVLTLIDARLLLPGVSACHVFNFSGFDLIIKDNTSGPVITLTANQGAIIDLVGNSTNAGVWLASAFAATQRISPSPPKTVWAFGAVYATNLFITDDAHEYNQQLDTWVNHINQIPLTADDDGLSFATSSISAAVAILSGGGNNSTHHLETYRYTSNPLGAVARANSTQQHSFSAGETIDGHHHYSGGHSSTTTTAILREVWKYDDAAAGTWTQMMTLAAPRLDHSLTAGTDVTSAFAAGGRAVTSGASINTIEKLEPALNVVTLRTDMPIFRQNSPAVELEGNLTFPLSYSFVTQATFTNRVDEYLIATDSWRERSPLTSLTGGNGSGAVHAPYLEDTIYVFGGWGGGTSDGDRTFEMTPGTVVDTWREKANLPDRLRSANSGGAALTP